MKTRTFKTKGGNFAVLRSPDYATFFMTPAGRLLRPMPVSEWDWLAGASLADAIDGEWGKVDCFGCAQISSNRMAQKADAVNLVGWLPTVPESELEFIQPRYDGSYCNSAYANVHGRICASRWVSADDNCFPWWEGEEDLSELYKIR